VRKAYKVIWGAVTPMPIIMIAAGFILFFVFIFKNIPLKGATPTPPMPEEFIGAFVSFYGLIILGVILGFFIHISYFIHLVRRDEMNKDTRTLWVVLFLVLNILAMIVYWFMVVLPQPEPGAEPESALLPEEPKPRTRRSRK
jgi:hypothetical protein